MTKKEGHDKNIKLDDNLMMEMRYPSLDQFIKSNFDFAGENALDQSFELIATCIDKIFNEEEVWSTSDCTKEEIIDFLEQMNSSQFKRLRSFLIQCLNYLMKSSSKILKPRNKIPSSWRGYPVFSGRHGTHGS